MHMSNRICFFFFQAEDGIRDYKVTGVQTCALPISRLCFRGCSVPSRQVLPSAFVQLCNPLISRPMSDISQEWLTPLRHRPSQSSYARCPHGTTTRKQRAVATATTPDPSLRAFYQRRSE